MAIDFFGKRHGWVTIALPPFGYRCVLLVSRAKVDTEVYCQLDSQARLGPTSLLLAVLREQMQGMRQLKARPAATAQ